MSQLCRQVCSNDFGGALTIGLLTECSCANAASSRRNSSNITIANKVSVETFFFRGFFVDVLVEMSVGFFGFEEEEAGSS